jgi:hypothetical protein
MDICSSLHTPEQLTSHIPNDPQKTDGISTVLLPDDCRRMILLLLLLLLLLTMMMIVHHLGAVR